MRKYALRRVTGEYTLEQESDDGSTLRRIVGRDSIHDSLRARMDANIGKRLEVIE